MGRMPDRNKTNRVNVKKTNACNLIMNPFERRASSIPAHSSIIRAFDYDLGVGFHCDIR